MWHALIRKCFTLIWKKIVDFNPIFSQTSHKNSVRFCQEPLLNQYLHIPFKNLFTYISLGRNEITLKCLIDAKFEYMGAEWKLWNILINGTVRIDRAGGGWNS